jgi:hypothetical protein
MADALDFMAWISYNVRPSAVKSFVSIPSVLKLLVADRHTSYSIL